MLEYLKSLEGKGLVSRIPGRPARYIPTPPDVAVEVLAKQLEEEIDRARASTVQLAEEFRQGAELVPPDVVQVLTGREAVVQRFEQLQRSARREVRMFDRPPYARGNTVNTTELELLQHGIRYRVIYDRRSLEVPGQLEWLDTLTRAGEEARVLADVPLKLDLADDRLALVPLSLDEPGVQMRLLVYPSPLLKALSVVFEAMWKQAIPVLQVLDEHETLDAEPDELAPEARQLLALLAAGLKDAAIARQLGLGLRTVRRRISNLMGLVGAETRYQAGLQAARRGWS